MKQQTVIAVSGLKDAGKTTLIEALIPALAARGLSVATVKHDGHRFQADRPGTDSFRHFAAGAVGTAVYDGEKFQLVQTARVDERDLIARFPQADLILIEGLKHSSWPKIAVLRGNNAALSDFDEDSLLAVVTDRAGLTAAVPVFGFSDTEALCDRITDLVRARQNAARGAGKEASAILLAGGYSSRMGRNKAELDFHGLSFLGCQVKKLRAVGIEDIVISGFEAVPEGCRFVPDLVPHRGPLSGIHAGLQAIRHPRALVLAVDTPLIPETLLETLIERHRDGITLAAHGGEPEPLIGVYDRQLAPLCGELLRGERPSVRRLLDMAGYTAIPFRWDPVLLSNCNTPEEYEALRKMDRVVLSSGKEQ